MLRNGSRWTRVHTPDRGGNDDRAKVSRLWNAQARLDGERRSWVSVQRRHLLLSGVRERDRLYMSLVFGGTFGIRGSWRHAAAATLIVAPLAAMSACSATRHITNTSSTALQQLLGTEAIDRAVDQLTWPDVMHKSVAVQSASPGEWGDEQYLRKAVVRRLAERGARVIDDPTAADYLVTVLAGSLGTDHSEVFFGIPPIQSILIPLSLPEIALYKAENQEGFAKTEIVVTDVRHGGVVHQAGPTHGQTYSRTRKFLFFGWYRTDTTRYK